MTGGTGVCYDWRYRGVLCLEVQGCVMTGDTGVCYDWRYRGVL